MRDISRQSLKKIMIFGSESWNDSYVNPSQTNLFSYEKAEINRDLRDL